MKKVTVLILIIFSLVVANTASKAGAFLRYGLDARSEGLGRAIVADKMGSANYYFNPATLARTKDKTVYSTYRVLSLDRSFAYLGYSMPITEQAGVSAGVLYTATDDIEARDLDGIQFDTYSFNENMFHLSFGLSPKENVAIGINTKVNYARFPEFNGEDETVTAYSFAVDFGALYTLKYMNETVTFGGSIRNVKGSYTWDSKGVWSEASQKTDDFAKTYEVGLSYTPSFYVKTTGYLSFEAREGDDKYLRGGVEYKEDFDNKYLSLRLGMNNDQPAFGLGFSFNLNGYQAEFDYSYTYEDITPSDPHTMSLKFMF